MRLRLNPRRFLPVGAVFTAAFGLYYLFWGVVALRRGSVAFGLFYGVYGLGGLVLSFALARLWRQLRRPNATGEAGARPDE